MHRDPNKPVTGASYPEDGDGPRVHNADTGSAARDGYTVLARRPRTSFTTESVEPEKAADIERQFKGMKPFG